MKLSQDKTQPKYLNQPHFLDQHHFFFFNLSLIWVLISLYFYSHIVLKASTAYFSTAPNSHLHALYAILFVLFFFFFSPSTVWNLWTQERQLEDPYLLHNFIPLNFYTLLSCPFHLSMTHIQSHRDLSSDLCLWNNSRSSGISSLNVLS